MRPAACRLVPHRPPPGGRVQPTDRV